MTSQTNPAPIAFPVKKVRAHAPVNEGLVRMLDGMLESAKKGELQSVACACVYASDLEPGGNTGEGWQMAPYTNYAMSHALGLLNYKIRHILYGD